ncbi:MAG: hypothetical protein K6T88_00160 [Bacillus sp. (in: Bacteria)]|nr:hypothetical protein [Bacillus sp. (in: firmicutes)]
MLIRMNEKELPYLDSQVMTAIFDCVYGVNDYLDTNTKRLLKEKIFVDFIMVLLAHQQFNYQYRPDVTRELFPLFESTVGPMSRHSDGAGLWLALGLAIKELYGINGEKLKTQLKSIKARK